MTLQNECAQYCLLIKNNSTVTTAILTANRKFTAINGLIHYISGYTQIRITSRLIQLSQVILKLLEAAVS